MKKTWTEESIVELLNTSDAAVQNAIIAIYKLQTYAEKTSSLTKELNGVGFASCDSRLGTYYARWILSGNKLTGKHLRRARLMATKYRKQLLQIARKKNAN